MGQQLRQTREQIFFKRLCCSYETPNLSRPHFAITECSGNLGILVFVPLLACQSEMLTHQILLCLYDHTKYHQSRQDGSLRNKCQTNSAIPSVLDAACILFWLDMDVMLLLLLSGFPLSV
jgi:hypothetical protein